MGKLVVAIILVVGCFAENSFAFERLNPVPQDNAISKGAPFKGGEPEVAPLIGSETPAPEAKTSTLETLTAGAVSITDKSSIKSQVTVLKAWLKLSDTPGYTSNIPLIISTTPSLKTDASPTSASDNTIDSILNKDGGTLNVMIGYNWTGIHFGNTFKYNSPEDGLSATFRIGGKMVEGYVNNEAKQIAFGQSSLGARLLMPIDDGSFENRVGSLSLEVNAIGDYVNSDVYQNMFGNAAPSLFGHIDGSVDLIILHQFTISLGGTLTSSNNTVNHRTYFTVSLSK